jgi:uncharacterized protein (TIGR04255 family)
MTSNIHYPNAPITEAVLDIQVTSAVSVETLARVNEGESNYPKSEKLNAGSGAVMFGPDANTFATATSQPLGYLTRSSDGFHIYQARLNGFTFSRLFPYPHWSAFSGEGRRLWEKYQAVARPSAITRVALRYVNRIDIPLPVNDFADYLRTVPQISTDLPQGLSSYFMQLAIPLADIKGGSVINQTIIEPAKPAVVSLVLDIDVFRTVDIPQTDPELWDLFEQLRKKKNEVFEACITEEARRLFR